MQSIVIIFKMSTTYFEREVSAFLRLDADTEPFSSIIANRQIYLLSPSH
jgi:hypothetical protein